MTNLNASQPPGADEGPKIPEVQAKQGRRGTHTFVILVVSTLLAVVVMFGLWSLRAGGLSRDDHSTRDTKAAGSKMFNQGPAASSERYKAPS